MPLGIPLSQASLSNECQDRALREWGGYIAQVHGLTDQGNRFGYLGEHSLHGTAEYVARGFSSDRFERELQDIGWCGVYDQ